MAKFILFIFIYFLYFFDQFQATKIRNDPDKDSDSRFILLNDADKNRKNDRKDNNNNQNDIEGEQGESNTATTTTISPQDQLDTTFSITASPKGDSNLIFSNGDNNTLELSLKADGEFVIANEKANIIQIKGNKELSIESDVFKTRNLQFNGSLLYANVPQWRLIENENFWSPPKGWSMNEITTCGGAFLLGGYCVLSRGQIQKKFTGIPKHSQLRISADFHYIDAWTGETAYLQVDTGSNNQNVYIWTDRYDSTMAVNSINICGAHYGEGKFSTKIDIIIPHNSDSIIITFGTTADQDPCDQSWGISNLSLYII